MKTFIRRTALTSIAIMFLLGGTTAAFANTPSQAFKANMGGSVTNFGAQTYTISGGQVVYGYIDNVAIDSNSQLQYNLLANQDGLTTRGFASIHFSGTAGGVPVRINGVFQIGAADAGAGLPSTCNILLGNCQQIVPFDFIGTSNVQFSYGAQTQTETMVVESPYWNPWGGPIYLVSPDQQIIIVATYTQATALWAGAQTTGTLTGSLGSSPVSGSFTITTNEFENFVAGSATDSGSIQFNTNIAALNTKGTYSGSDTIPMATALDCTYLTNLPYTCLFTGFQSNGSFKAGGLTGTYSTSWWVPAVLFTSTVSGTLSQGGQSGNSLWGFLQNFLGHR